MNKLCKTSLIATLLAGGLLTGCSSKNDVSLTAITMDYSPELTTLNQRPVDIQRHMAYTNDINVRLFWEDLGRVMITDHPSRLNPIEIVSVSGKPH